MANKYKLLKRELTNYVSDRLLQSVTERFNLVMEYLPEGDKKYGFGKSSYIDEWFNWTNHDMDYWSMANHLFLIDTRGE